MMAKIILNITLIQIVCFVLLANSQEFKDPTIAHFVQMDSSLMLDLPYAQLAPLGMSALLRAVGMLARRVSTLMEQEVAEIVPRAINAQEGQIKLNVCLDHSKVLQVRMIVEVAKGGNINRIQHNHSVNYASQVIFAPPNL